MKPLRTFAESIAAEHGVAPAPTSIRDVNVDRVSTPPSAMESWDRIEKNIHKIPGMSSNMLDREAAITVANSIFVDQNNQGTWMLADRGPEGHRFLALKLMDAIELAGIDRFWRIPLKGGRVKIECERCNLYAIASRAEDHLAYLDILAQLIEAYPSQYIEVFGEGRA